MIERDKSDLATAGGRVREAEVLCEEQVKKIRSEVARGDDPSDGTARLGHLEALLHAARVERGQLIRRQSTSRLAR